MEEGVNIAPAETRPARGKLNRLLSKCQRKTKPWGLKWRSSVWFVTLVVGYGITTDLVVYAIIIPVVPFQLEKEGHSSSSVSALTAWLLFAYSVGLVIFTPPISWFSERYNIRKAPLLWGLLALSGFLVMFMEAPNYPVMVVARLVQGISSSVVWVVGLALLCDTVPEQKIGRQLGLAMLGLTIGTLAAPPIGGALYDRFGFRAPFIFGIIAAITDLIGRLLVIERVDALAWGHDPMENGHAIPNTISESVKTANGTGQDKSKETSATGDMSSNIPQQNPMDPSAEASANRTVSRLSGIEVVKFMLKSPRTLTALFSVFIYGVVYTGLEPTLPLRLQDLYGFDSSKVGLIYLACAIPTIFSAPLTGWISDRFGVEWIILISILTTIPWYALLVIQGRLAFFIACIVIMNFALSGAVSPLTAELASITRSEEGIGYAHIYGAFNLAYGIGSTVGPLVAGQIYSHASRGWLIVLSYGSGLLFFTGVLSFFFMGERPLASRLRCRN